MILAEWPLAIMPPYERRTCARKSPIANLVHVIADAAAPRGHRCRPLGWRCVSGFSQSMSRESCLLRGPLMHELLLFVAQLGRRMEEIVISGRHGTAIHDSINQRGHRTALLHIQS